MLGAASFRAAEHLPVEVARGSKVVDGECQMERLQAHSICLRVASSIVEPLLRR
jgi:hypothetical protein